MCVTLLAKHLASIMCVTILAKLFPSIMCVTLLAKLFPYSYYYYLFNGWGWVEGKIKEKTTTKRH